MDLMDYRRKIIANSPHLMSAEGAVVSFADGADLPLKSLNVGIEPVQSGSGDPSPDNVRPISGWNGVKVTRAGKNLLDLSNLRKGNFAGATNNTNVSFDEHQPIKGGQTYVWSSPLSDISGRYLRFYDADKIELSDRVNLYGTGAKTFSVPSNACYFRCMWYRTTGIEPTDIVADQIELGSTATPYEPYNGDVYEVSLSSAGTVYGGTLNPLTGVLTAYPYYASYNGETLTGRWVSDRDKYVAGTTPTIGAQVVDMSGTGTEIQLTPHQIRTLYGNNTIFADTGNVALEYWAHP